jgi:hypothetical protein
MNTPRTPDAKFVNAPFVSAEPVHSGISSLAMFVYPFLSLSIDFRDSKRKIANCAGDFAVNSPTELAICH